ncbi:MAG TPA: GntR family transcriptional regulator [Acidobacteriaceae bacterium]|jgi:GntR family transcriptional regulator|nr:GntR family transcriptional regulator [Acidobacteriaceae bacterium]
MKKLQQLDRNSVVPLYYQIQEQLLERIRSGEFAAGQPLPPLQEIAATLGVSPMTARQAIKSLCDLGVLYSRQGTGTFISGMKLEKDFRQVLSFTEEMKARGSRPRSRVLSFETRTASREIQEALRLRTGDQVIELRRVRQANALPMGVECSSLPLQLCPGLLDTFDPRTSLYKTLAERYGLHMAIADEVVEVGLANREEARLLRVSEKSPVFIFTRTSYVQSGQPVEYVKATYRGDRYKIVNRLTRLNRALLASARPM